MPITFSEQPQAKAVSPILKDFQKSTPFLVKLGKTRTT
jgi:hypothetical protein